MRRIVMGDFRRVVSRVLRVEFEFARIVMCIVVVFVVVIVVVFVAVVAVVVLIYDFTEREYRKREGRVTWYDCV